MKGRSSAFYVLRSGQILNRAELARDAGISPNTAGNWLSILQASGIVYLLEPYHSNVTKRLVKAPKLYFLDTGLCAYLTLILHDGTLFPLEIKKTALPGKEAIRHFLALKRLNKPVGPGGVICLAEQSLPLMDSFLSIPVSAI